MSRIFFLLQVDRFAFFGTHFEKVVPKVEINPFFKAEIVDVEMVAAVKLTVMARLLTR